MNNQDLTKFEFLLTLEKNIIIQRFFSVPNYNPNVKNSLDLYYGLKDICEDIQRDLKKKTLTIMSDEYNYYDSLDELDEKKEIIEEVKEEYFLLQIKLENEIFIQRIFPAHVFHPKTRYSVDIRPMVRTILGNLTNILSNKKLETKYLQYDLSL